MEFLNKKENTLKYLSGSAAPLLYWISSLAASYPSPR